MCINKNKKFVIVYLLLAKVRNVGTIPIKYKLYFFKMVARWVAYFSINGSNYMVNYFEKMFARLCPDL